MASGLAIAAGVVGGGVLLYGGYRLLSNPTAAQRAPRGAVANSDVQAVASATGAAFGFASALTGALSGGARSAVPHQSIGDGKGATSSGDPTPDSPADAMTFPEQDVYATGDPATGDMVGVGDSVEV